MKRKPAIAFLLAALSMHFNRVVANVRFRLNPREGNDLYIVYDEGLHTDIHRLTPGLPHSVGRTVLLKYTYTFRL